MNGFSMALCAALALAGCASQQPDTAATSGIASGANAGGAAAAAQRAAGHRSNYTVSCEVARVDGAEELRAVMVFDGGAPIRLNPHASALYCGLAGATPAR